MYKLYEAKTHNNDMLHLHHTRTAGARNVLRHPILQRSLNWPFLFCHEYIILFRPSLYKV